MQTRVLCYLILSIASTKSQGFQSNRYKNRNSTNNMNELRIIHSLREPPDKNAAQLKNWLQPQPETKQRTQLSHHHHPPLLCWPLTLSRDCHLPSGETPGSQRSQDTAPGSVDRKEASSQVPQGLEAGVRWMVKVWHPGTQKLWENVYCFKLLSLC